MSEKYSNNEEIHPNETVSKSENSRKRQHEKRGVVYNVAKEKINKLLQQENIVDDPEALKGYLDKSSLAHWSTVGKVRRSLSEMESEGIINDYDRELIRNISQAVNETSYKEAFNSAFIRLIKKGLDDAGIAEELGCSRTAITKRRVELGYPSNKKIFRELRSYGNPTKAEIRRIDMEFCKSHQKKDPKDIKVVGLLGHETYDLDQIFDQMGIRRKNILNVEIDERALYRYRSHKTGTKTHKGDIEEFLKKVEDRFDIGLLDFEGYTQEKYLACLRLIFERKLLSDNAVLSLTYSASREQKFSQRLIQHAGTHEFINQLSELKKSGREKEALSLISRFVKRPYSVLKEHIDELFAEEALNARIESSRTIRGTYVVKDVERLMYVGRKTPMRSVIFYFERTKKRSEEALKEMIEGIEKVKNTPIVEVRLPENLRKEKIEGGPRQLSKIEREEIRERVKTIPKNELGRAARELAKEYNVSVGQIRAFYSWNIMKSRR